MKADASTPSMFLCPVCAAPIKDGAQTWRINSHPLAHCSLSCIATTYGSTTTKPASAKTRSP